MGEPNDELPEEEHSGEDVWVEEVARLMAIEIDTDSVTPEPEPEPEPEPDPILLQTQETRERLLPLLRAVVPDGATFDTLVPGSVPSEVASLLETGERLALEITTADLDRLTQIEGEITTLQQAVDREKDKVAARADTASKLSDIVKPDPVPKGATKLESDPITAAREAAQTALQTDPLTDDALELADNSVKEMQTAIEQANLAITTREESAKTLREAAGKFPDIPNQIETEAKRLSDLRQAIATALASDPLTPDALKTATDALRDLQSAHEQIQSVVTARAEEHDRIETAGLEIDETGHLPDQIETLKARRDALQEALKPPITTERNKLADTALSELRKAAQQVTQELKDLGDKEGIDKLCTGAGITLEDYAELEKDLGGRTGLSEILKTFPADALGALTKTIDAKTLKTLIDGFDSVAAFKSTMEKVGGADAMKKLVDSGAPMDKIQTICTDLGPGFVNELLKQGEGKAVADLHAAFGSDIKAFTDLAKDSGLATNPKAMLALLKTGCNGEADKFRDFCKGFSKEEDRQNLKSMLEGGGLGDAPDAFGALVATGCDGDPKAMIQLGTSLNSDEARAGLKLALTDGGLGGGDYEKGKGKVDPNCLAMMLKHATGPRPAGQDDDADLKRRCDGLATLFKGLEKEQFTQLNGMLTKGGLGDAPEAFAHALGLGCGGDPDQVKEFTDNFKTDEAQTALNRMLTKGGLAGKPGPLADGDIDPKCLGHLLRSGAGDDPTPSAKDRMAKMATLLQGLEEDDCTKLSQILGEGGLGQAPEAFAHTISIGCNSDPEAFKSFSNSFDEKSAREGLAKLLDQGGLKGSPPPLKPTEIDQKTLGNMLKFAGGEKPGSMSDKDYTAQCCTDFAKLCGGLDDDGCTSLKKTMQDSGLNTDLEVLGKLIGTGCKSDSAKLKSLTTELAKDPNGTNLKNLLTKGGFGTKDDTGVKSDTATECLANLFEPGCDGAPGELVKLLTQLNDSTANPGALANLKGVMTKGDLGKHPKVLGDLYKHGCLTDPNGAPDGKGGKNPKLLIQMVGGFSGDTDAPKFKDLLDNGGLSERDDKGKVSRLASVMRYGITPKDPSTDKDGGKLRGIYDAFKVGGDHMGDLKSTLESIEQAPDWVLEPSDDGKPTQPGKGLCNILFSGTRDGNPGDLHSGFFTKLETRDSEAQSGLTPKLSMKKLIQTAASFESVPIDPSEETVLLSPTGLDPINLRLDHVLERHTRKQHQLSLPSITQNTATTLYPRDIGVTELSKSVKTSLEGFPGGTPPYVRKMGGGGTDNNTKRSDGTTDRNIPPKDVEDVTGDYGFFEAVSGTYVDKDGTTQAITSKIGFNPDPSDTGAPQKVYVAQFFPETGPNLLKVHNHDMHAIKDALTR